MPETPKKPAKTPTARTRAKRTYMPKEEREAQIIAGAIKFVSERGLRFTTRELAEALGIAQPLLYRYFKNKTALVERIYEEVYLSRWNPEWEDWLRDRSVPMKDRLIRYLKDYVRAIVRKDWIRIFMLSAFDDPIISQRYIGLLQRRIFDLILDEMRHDAGRDPLTTPEEREMALEIIWGFHSSFFYLGVRRWIYRTPVPEDMDRLVELRVEAFLTGAPEQINRI